ncbi:MAG: hypothetical protein WDW38_000751 [Sanguina aurantia]
MLNLLPLLLTRCSRHQPLRSAAALALQAPPCSSSSGSWHVNILTDWSHAPSSRSFSTSKLSSEPKTDGEIPVSTSTNSDASLPPLQSSDATSPLHSLPQAAASIIPPTVQAPRLSNPLAAATPPSPAAQPELPELGIKAPTTVRSLSPSLDQETYQRHVSSLNEGLEPAASQPAYFPSKQDDGYGVQVGTLTERHHPIPHRSIHNSKTSPILKRIAVTY